MSRKTAQWQGYLLRMGPAYLVLVICLAASWVVYHRVSENVEARDEARFDQLTKGASNAVVQRIETYISALRGARGLFEAYHRVGVRQCHDYVRSLRLDSNYRGMMDIGYAERVEGVHRESHVALMRSQGMATTGSIRPGLDPKNWGGAHGNQTPAWGILQTAGPTWRAR